MKELARQLDDPGRRAFLAQAARACFGLGLGLPFLTGEEPGPGGPVRRPTARRVIYLFMNGGMSHLDTFDLKPGHAVQGPVEALTTSADGVRISGYLPQLAGQMHHAAVFNSLTSNQGAHQQGQYYMHTSFVQRGSIIHPAMGSWLTHFSPRLNPTLPANVLVGGGGNHPGCGYLSSVTAPLPIGDPGAGLQFAKAPRGVDEERYRRRLELSEAFGQRFAARAPGRQPEAYRQAYHEALTLMRSDDLDAFNIQREPREIHELYGDSRFGQGCLLARRLVEHDVRFVEVSLGGWDTHTDNFERVADQCATLDQALAALLLDLERRGLLDETLVVLATEFGRKPTVNGNGGRDHHPACFSCLLAGGGIIGGRVIGRTDERAGKVLERPVTVPDFNATIGYALGLPISETVHSASGRPFTLADKGRPVLEAFG